VKEGERVDQGRRRLLLRKITSAIEERNILRRLEELPATVFALRLPCPSRSESTGVGWQLDDRAGGSLEQRHRPNRVSRSRARSASRDGFLPPGGRVRFRLSIDGQPPGAARGDDIDADGNGTVIEPRLYQLIRQPTLIGDRRFEIEVPDADVEAFAFTFG
jgi:hypothetical protein